MSEPILLKFRTLDTGHGSTIAELRVAAIIEIDGQPYQPPEEQQQIRDLLMALYGRVDAIENRIESMEGHMMASAPTLASANSLT